MALQNLSDGNIISRDKYTTMHLKFICINVICRP